MREACSPLIFPPTGQSSDGKLWRIGGGPHIDRATIVADIIDPIGNGSQEGIVWKVMQHSPSLLPDPRLAQHSCALPINSFFLVSTLMIGEPAA